MGAKESEEDELESLTSNEAMLESGSVIKEAKVRYFKPRDGLTPIHMTCESTRKYRSGLFIWNHVLF